MAQGSHAQLIVVVPEEDIVTVLTAARPEAEPPISPSDVADYVSRCVRAGKDLPLDSKGEARLTAALQSAAIERHDDITGPPPLAAEISGKSYEFDTNPLRLKSLSLNLAGPNPTWSVSRQETAINGSIKTISGPIGLNGVFPDEPSEDGAPLVKGRWLGATSFEVQSRVLGQGVIDRWIFEFRGAGVNLHFENNEGFSTELRGTMRP